MTAQYRRLHERFQNPADALEFLFNIDDYLYKKDTAFIHVSLADSVLPNRHYGMFAWVTRAELEGRTYTLSFINDGQVALHLTDEVYVGRTYMDSSVEIRASGDHQNITYWCTPDERARLAKFAAKRNARVEAIVKNAQNADGYRYCL